MGGDPTVRDVAELQQLLSEGVVIVDSDTSGYTDDQRQAQERDGAADAGYPAGRSLAHFLRSAPTLSVIPRDTPDDQLTARHPGYDARTAQRDPNTVFPLSVLRELETAGHVRLAEAHYSFTGATSQARLRDQVAPQWAEGLQSAGVDACLLVAT